MIIALNTINTLFSILNEKIDEFEIPFNLYIQEPFISR